MTKEEIFDKLKAILSKEFEIEEDKITSAAKLVDDYLEKELKGAKADYIKNIEKMAEQYGKTYDEWSHPVRGGRDR